MKNTFLSNILFEDDAYGNDPDSANNLTFTDHFAKACAVPPELQDLPDPPAFNPRGARSSTLKSTSFLELLKEGGSLPEKGPESTVGHTTSQQL